MSLVQDRTEFRALDFQLLRPNYRKDTELKGDILRRFGLMALLLTLLAVGGTLLLKRVPDTLKITEPLAEPKRPTLCSFIPSRNVALNSAYLAKIMNRQARALVMPEHDAKCLPVEHTGPVEFLNFEPPQFIPYAHAHSLNLRLSKSDLTYSLDYFSKDLSSLNTLGFSSSDELRKELVQIYGEESLAEKHVWIGVAAGSINWSKKHSEVPALHPFATVISTATLKKLLTEEKPQFIDVRESLVPLQTFEGAITFNRFSSNFRSRVQPPETLPQLKNLLVQLDRTKPTVIFDKNETRFAAYNLATVLGKEGFENIYLLRTGLDDWLGQPVEAPPYLEGIPLITGAEIIELKKKKTPLLLDVRNKGSYRIHHLKDSKTSPVSNFINVVTARSIIQVLPEQRPIIIYGKNEYDWRPYKVIKKLLEIQPELKKDILWYRQGMSDAHFNASLRYNLPENERLDIVIPVPKDMERVQHLEGNFEIPDDPIEDVRSESQSPSPTASPHDAD